MESRTPWQWPLIAMALTAAFFAQAQDRQQDRQDEPIFIRTQAGIQVDAAGRVASVAMDPELPAALSQHASTVIQTWTFVPVMQDGRPVGGKTYANVNLCLMPSGEYFTVGVDYAGNGPGDADADPASKVPPFPSSLLSPDAHVKFDGEVRFRVESDGRVTLLDATLTDPDLQRRHGRGWYRQVRGWLSKRRFKPELIDGQATATVMEMPISFELNRPATPAERQDEQQRRRASSDACQTAAGESGRREMTSDSRFVLAPDI